MIAQPRFMISSSPTVLALKCSTIFDWNSSFSESTGRKNVLQYAKDSATGKYIPNDTGESFKKKEEKHKQMYPTLAVQTQITKYRSPLLRDGRF